MSNLNVLNTIIANNFSEDLLESQKTLLANAFMAVLEDREVMRFKVLGNMTYDYAVRGEYDVMLAMSPELLYARVSPETYAKTIKVSDLKKLVMLVNKEFDDYIENL